MRLINIEMMTIEQFSSEEKRPDYAILSHTWGTGEVTFQDFGQPWAESMAGLSKIKYLCHQALLDGLDYVWIDTCCIDKSSSSELSEAINSMFQWYMAAKVCYAYLIDVAADGSDYDAVPEFKRSVWFTRGWTLQELLAPREVTFFGKNWNCIGTRSALGWAISEVTGIPKAVLQNYLSCFSYSIATRMSWAAERRTTRVEDRAYSLLGIFRVNIPLLYGEGWKAFQRLQEELIRSSDDETIFVHSHTALVANSPTAFIRSGAVFQLERRKLSAPYSITNKGLHIELPILRLGEIGESGSCQVGILSCHYQNDYSNFIAIELDQSRTSGVYRKSLARGIRDVHLVSEKAAKAAVLQRIYIRPGFYEARMATYRLRSESARQYGYEVRMALSRTLTWDPFTQIYRTTPAATHGSEPAAIFFFNTTTSSVFCITSSEDVFARPELILRVFSFPSTRHSVISKLAVASEDELHEMAEKLDELPDFTSNEVVRTVVRGTVPSEHRIEAGPSEYKFDLTVSHEREELLGQDVHVIDVSLRPAKESYLRGLPRLSKAPLQLGRHTW